MEHSFNTMAAQEVGLIPAVLLNHIYFWVTKNKADGCNCYDNQYWTRMSKKGFLQYFSYLTERQVEYALTKLRDGGYIAIGNYNKNSFDRSLWYTITESGYKLLEVATGNQEKLKKSPGKKSVSKKTYSQIFSAEENSTITEALQKFIHQCSGKGIRFQTATVEGFAEFLREESGDNPEIAMRIVDQSLEKGWKRLYKLKNYNAGQKGSNIERVPYNPENEARDEKGERVVY